MKRGTGVKISSDQYQRFLKDGSDLASLGVRFDLFLSHVLSIVLARVLCALCVCVCVVPARVSCSLG